MSEINHNWGVLLDKRKIEFFDGVKDLLYYLKNKGFFLGIATSRDMEELRELSDIIECLNLFDYVVTSDMVKYPKPNPESINMIIDKYNLNRDETIYIGDSKSDLETARSANVSFGFANWENKNEIEDYDYLFLEPNDIYDLEKKHMIKK